MSTAAVGNQATIQQIIDNSTNNKQSRNTGDLGKDDFLNLLVTQLRYQDPLKPMEDKEFISQLAQFNVLEQMQNMNASFSSVKAFNLIGKTITANIVDEISKQTKIVEGEVSSVKMYQGKAFVIVDDQEIPVDSVVLVSDEATTRKSDITGHTNLIGHNIKGFVYDSKSQNIIKIAGVVKALNSDSYGDYATVDGVKIDISGINTEGHSTDPDYIADYLESNINNVVSLIAVDRNNDQKVPVTARLKEYSIQPDGRITVTLDGMNIFIESIYGIESIEQTPETE